MQERDADNLWLGLLAMLIIAGVLWWGFTGCTLIRIKDPHFHLHVGESPVTAVGEVAELKE